MSISVPFLNIFRKQKFIFIRICVFFGILIALAYTLIALAHLNSSEKMHRLPYRKFLIRMLSMAPFNRVTIKIR